MNKYTFIIEGSEYNKKEIIFTENNKKTTKVNLNKIDELTTNFINEEELIKFLIEKITDVKDIKSMYIVDEENKKTEIAYSDKQILSLLDVVDNKINIECQDFKKVLFNFLKSIEDQEFCDYITNFLSKELKKEIIRRIKLGDYSNNCVYEIAELLSNYLEMRQLFIKGNEYKLDKLEKQRKKIELKYKKIMLPRL